MNINAIDLQLERRTALPDALRSLIEQFPRDIWEGHSNFGEMVQFWLQRHLMFRRLLAMIQEDVESLENKTISPHQFRQRFARLGNTFVGELHMHHNVEDQHYFPLLIELENSLARGFEILDHDHHAIDGHLEDFTTQANIVLSSNDQQLDTEMIKLHEKISKIEGFLNRHLTDEEELVVPIVLKHGFDN